MMSKASGLQYAFMTSQKTHKDLSWLSVQSSVLEEWSDGWKEMELFVRSGELIIFKLPALVSPALPPGYKNYIALGVEQSTVRGAI